MHGESLAPFSYFGTQIQLEGENLEWSEGEGSSVQAYFYIWDSVSIKLDCPYLWGPHFQGFTLQDSNMWAFGALIAALDFKGG